MSARREGRAPGLPHDQAPQRPQQERGLAELWYSVWPGLTCTFWPAISVGLGGRGGGCRSPVFITYCSRLTSRAQESAQLCTCTTLLEQRSSNSGWLCRGRPRVGDAMSPGSTPATDRTGWVFPGVVSLSNSPTEWMSTLSPPSGRGLAPGHPRKRKAVPWVKGFLSPISFALDLS